MIRLELKREFSKFAVLIVASLHLWTSPASGGRLLSTISSPPWELVSLLCLVLSICSICWMAGGSKHLARMSYEFDYLISRQRSAFTASNFAHTSRGARLIALYKLRFLLYVGEAIPWFAQIWPVSPKSTVATGLNKPPHKTW